MEQIEVKAGQFVLSGEPWPPWDKTRFAGSAALTLASERPTLYIEFRKDGQPVDPRCMVERPEVFGKGKQ
jgi:septal ring factor EnvC (AmiA/AmiB activator)